MKKPKVKKEKIKKFRNIHYQETLKYKIIMDIIAILSAIVSIISLYYTILVRSDTAELSKFSDKPIYYTISLYPTENSNEFYVTDKYVNLDLTLIVDDFVINKKDFLDVNYNSVFTKEKYFMVYDYDKEIKDYKYMRYKLDDKTQSQLRLEGSYYGAFTNLNYSLTPNNKYCYILIYTETTSEKNLDLVFFKYTYDGDYFQVDTVADDNGVVKVNIERIDSDINICKDYFINLWSSGDAKSKEDLEFMFDVYNDLSNKLESVL